MMEPVDLNCIRNLLESSRTVAMVGLSPKENRPSNMVAKYLMSVGYTIIPVNPGQETILGQTCYPDLGAVPEKVDVVDIFRRSADVPPVVDDAIRIGARAIWMQLGVVHKEAAHKARQAGLTVVMNRCMKTDHETLI